MSLVYKDLPVFSFATKEEFYEWLGAHFKNEKPFWLRYYKKASGKQTIAHTDAVDVALCWGWIDGLLNKYDDESYVVRYTPRRAKSIWSQVNVEKVERLISEGRMQPSGLEKVNAAKADGRWAAAYAGQSTITTPQPFIDRLKKIPGLLSYYQSLPKSQRYSYEFRLATAIGEDRKNKLYETLAAKLMAAMQDKNQ